MLSLYQLIKSGISIRKQATDFLRLYGLWTGLLVVWLTVMFSYEIEMLVLFSILIVSFFFILFKKRTVMNASVSKIVCLKVVDNKDENNTIAKKLELLMLDEKPYLNPKFTLPDLSKKADVPLHTLSKVLNETVGKSFPEYVNTYRIEAAKEKLISEDDTHLSIAGIAYDCGFNSISAFNTFFKKTTGTTPSRFRKMVV